MVNWSEAEREWWWMGPFAGQVPGLVRRVRRILDVSQRGLAALLGVSQSVVARWDRPDGYGVEAVSYGEEYPVAEGAMEAAWAQNRRADIKYPGE